MIPGPQSSGQFWASRLPRNRMPDDDKIMLLHYIGLSSLVVVPLVHDLLYFGAATEKGRTTRYCAWPEVCESPTASASYTPPPPRVNHFVGGGARDPELFGGIQDGKYCPRLEIGLGENSLASQVITVLTYVGGENVVK